MAKKEKYFVGFTESGRRWGTVVNNYGKAMKEERRYRSLNKKRVSTSESFSMKNLKKITGNFYQRMK